MFFEPPPPGTDRAGRAMPELPPWAGPPELELGAVVPVERIVARSANVVIVLPTARAFRSGCRFDVEIVSRQGAMSGDDWWALQMSGLPIDRSHTTGADRLPDRLLRLGVRYANGAKATTVGRPVMPRPGESDDPPSGPLLSWIPGGSGGGRRGAGNFMFQHFGLWLWPLPPAEPFEFAVEWPFAGIDLTFAELDGAALASAAGRSAPYWPSPAGPDG